MLFPRNAFRRRRSTAPTAHATPAAHAVAVAGPGPVPAAGAVLAAAEEFLLRFADEHPGAAGVGPRLREVRAEVEAHGTYEHTPEELAFGARLAWRNSARCIGRLYWRSLVVRDLRQLRHPDDIADACVDHLRLAGNGGRIRPMVSVFAPDRPGRPAARLLSGQLVQYADDPANRERLELARELGWRGGKEEFDVMPLLLQGAVQRPPEYYELPGDAVLEVPLSHPQHPGFAGLGLRWYAVPAVSDMTLEIGGVSYPAAPFNGWYMGTEIGSRDLGDTARYNRLPAVADLFGLDTSGPRTLWQDRALVELNLAVLHSFQQAGVTVSDHHTESVRFLAHIEAERRHGRPVPADWSWIVPPLSGSATPVFHRSYDAPDAAQRPAFLRRAAPWP
ncbi:nitric oxide synthase oxygenase [Streptacidiphilus albus]|uniref:nitric oxide synthase oxygenase n=1 Tax=Streptacidiphilus albus TaxID=105425 RepID=UPI000B143F4E|nr:nitric oxide synthase oxygenase [Streptacidiphilus albus]